MFNGPETWFIRSQPEALMRAAIIMNKLLRQSGSSAQCCVCVRERELATVFLCSLGLGGHRFDYVLNL